MMIDSDDRAAAGVGDGSGYEGWRWWGDYDVIYSSVFQLLICDLC